mgnify:CR=1 FL=1
MFHSSLSLFVINKGNIINIKLATIMFISSIPPNFSFYNISMLDPDFNVKVNLVATTFSTI